jgi:hypothetical protein
MKIIIISILIVGLASSSFAIQLELDNPNGIAALWVQGQFWNMDMIYIVCTDGSGYACYTAGCTEWQSFKPSPVPLSEVAEWTPWIVFTHDGRWFRRDGAGAYEPWIELQTPPLPPCFEPVPSSNKSSGAIKSMFR